MSLVYIVSFISYFSCFIHIKATDCGSKTVGHSISTRANTPSGSANKAVFVQDVAHQFDCCGVVKKWTFVAKSAGTIKFQIWRLSTGTTYTVVGENVFTIPSNAVNEVIQFAVPDSERITVNANDYFGWQGDLLAYSDGDSSYPDNVFVRTQTFSVGDTFNFNMAATASDRAYAIQAETTNSVAPYFQNLEQTIHVYDHISPGSTIFNVTSVEEDYDYGGITISLPTLSSYFNLSGNAVQTSASIGPSTPQSLSIKAEDTCGKSVTSTLSIIVANQKPVITSLPTTYSIIETQNSELLIHTLTVSDGETISCSVSSTDPAGGPFTAKEVTSGSGTYGVYINANPGFDYDTTKRFDVMVRCTDTKDYDDKQLIVIITKNTVPVFNNLPASVTIDQQTTATNTQIGFINVTDTDSVTLNYTCSPSSCPISVANDGTVTTTSALSTVFIPGFDVMVSASDGHTSVGGKSWSMHISNINDVPQFSNIHSGMKYFGIQENSPIGSTVYTLSATDVDTGDTIAYTWTSSPNTGSSFFTLGSSTGVIETSSSLNYETMSDTLFLFTVHANDGKDTATATFSVSVIDVNEAPAFSLASHSITGTEAVEGTSLSQPGFVVSDPDNGDTQFYTMDCGGYNTGYFEMESSNGSVYLGREFDRDLGHPETTQCVVTVRDSGGLTATTNLTITITNIVDTDSLVFEAPIFTFFVSPSDPVGTTVGTTAAIYFQDISSAQSSVTYSLNMSNIGDSYFAIDSSGIITVNKNMTSEFSLGDIINITLVASNSGGLSATTTISIIFPEALVPTETTTTEWPNSYWDDPYNVAWMQPTFLALGSVLVLMVIMSVLYCRCEKEVVEEIDIELEIAKEKQRLIEEEKREMLIRKEEKKLKSVDFFTVEDVPQQPKKIPVHDKKREKKTEPAVTKPFELMANTQNDRNVLSWLNRRNSYPERTNSIINENEEVDKRAKKLISINHVDSA